MARRGPSESVARELPGLYPRGMETRRPWPRSSLLRALAIGGAVTALLAVGGDGLCRGEEEGQWAPLPSETKTVLLATGADRGFLRPRGCYGRFGGALYRAAFDGWLAEQASGIAREWISTGGVTGSIGEDRDNAPPDEMFRQLGRVGYRAVGLDEYDLRLYGIDLLSKAASSAGVPLLASNLRVFETGRPLMEERVILETPSGKVGIVSAMAYDAEASWGDPAAGTVLITRPAKTLRPIVENLRPEVRLLVLLSNLERTDLARLLEEVPGIDLVLVNRGTVEEVVPRFVKGVPALALGHAGRVLGRIALDRQGRILEFRGVWVRGAFPIDPLTGRPTSDPSVAAPSDQPRQLIGEP